MMDDQSWAIPQPVIKPGRRFSGQEVLKPASQADRMG